jgi:hypothetical protein
MAHDEHFLRRLDRVSDAHVERALTLYRDQELLREVLSRADLAPSVERLAISLDHPIDGPFVIVTRAGRFVTCLGAGMRVGREPAVAILTRERLDAAASKVERMRESLAEAEQLARDGGHGIASRAFRRMQTDGLRFCREDAEMLIGVWPLLARAAVLELSELQFQIRDLRKRVAYMRFDRLKPMERDLALAFGDAAWCMAHLLVLTDHEDSMRFVRELTASRAAAGEPFEIDVRFLASMTNFDLGTYAHVSRAVWALGRRPGHVLAGLKRLDSDPRRGMSAMRELGLGAIALAAPKVRAEATKALSRVPPKAVVPPDETVMDRLARTRAEWSGALGTFVREVIEEPETRATADAHALGYGRVVAARFAARSAEVSDEQVSAVAEPVARAMIASLPVSTYDDDQGAERMTEIVCALPWLARAEAAELFLPRAHAAHMRETSIDDVALMMKPYAKVSFLARPDPEKRATAKTGRNDPCGCGSGKKHKRCCGAAA